MKANWFLPGLTNQRKYQFEQEKGNWSKFLLRLSTNTSRWVCQRLCNASTQENSVSVWIATAAGGICWHGFNIIFVLLVVAWRLQAEIVAVVRRQHPCRDVRGLPGVVRGQDVWRNTTQKDCFSKCQACKGPPQRGIPESNVNLTWLWPWTLA